MGAIQGKMRMCQMAFKLDEEVKISYRIDKVIGLE